MRNFPIFTLLIILPLAAATLGTGCTADQVAAARTDETSEAFRSSHHHGTAKHVVLLSIDGLHPFDLDTFVASHPRSALASLAHRGTRYTNTTSSRPSDSFPGTLALTTGGSPSTTGVYYDVAWDDRLSPPGSACATRGAIAAFDGQANVDDTVVNAVLDPTKLPRDPDKGCSLVYPHDFLKVNTIFEVAKRAGIRTAVSDKHPAYEILRGPSGTGIDDLFTPENDANGAKKDIAKMEAYDETKVQAVLNQIDGYEHTRTTYVGVPGIIMMNFQSANIGEKVAGYADALGTPTPGLTGAFEYVDGAVGRMLAALEVQHLAGETLVILTAKHGNSPVDLASRRAIDPALIDAVVNGVSPGLLALNTPDTVELLWLKDHNRAAEVEAALQAQAGPLGIETIYAGNAVTTMFDGDLDYPRNRRPDIIIQPAPGVIYTTSGVSAKKVEHGGLSPENTHVPLVLAGPHVAAGVISEPVDLRQVAPTILNALGLRARELQAVRYEGTRRLPALAHHENDGCDDDD